MFDIYDTRVDISVEEIKEAGFMPLLCGGIINPMAPTLSVLALVSRAGSPDNNFELVEIMLNPFTQEAHGIGRTNGQPWGVEACGQLYEACGLQSCPTLFPPSVALLGPDPAEVLARWIRRFPNAERVWKMIKRHRGDPWNRITEERKGGTGSSVRESFMGRLRRQKGFTSDDARAFAVFVLSDKHSKPELQAFMYAWKGSIDFQETSGSSQLAASAMSLEDLMDWFGLLDAGCRNFVSA